MTNYRPILNLTFIAKVLEKLVAKRLSNCMEENILLVTMQSAYKTKYSMESALICIQNDILLALNKKQGVVLVLLDLSTVFDILLHRIEYNLGICDTAMNWFSSYLKDRSNAVSIGKLKYDLTQRLFGVPQGSVLGLIL